MDDDERSQVAGETEPQINDTDPQDSESSGDSSPGGGTSPGGIAAQKKQSRFDAWKKKQAENRKNRQQARNAQKFQKEFKKGAKKIAKKAASEGAKKATELAASESGIPEAWEATKALYKAGKEAYKALRGDIQGVSEDIKKKTKGWLLWALIPVCAILVLVVAGTILISFISHGPGEDKQAELIASSSSLSVTKTGPDKASPGETITYTITVTSSSDNPVLVDDRLPDGVEFVKASQKVTCYPTCDPSSKIISWDSEANNIATPINTSFTITVKIKTTANNTYQMNQADGL